MIPQDTIQQVLSRLDIIEVVGSFVKLKKRGANYIGLCPFHNEKTPSFSVSASKEIYKCFGCGKSGNTISFLMEHEKFGYIDAIKWLANKYGVEIQETFVNDEQRQQYQTADSLYILNQFAQKFFSEQLFDTDEGQNVGLSYFEERGFSEDTIRRFQLGYAPDGRDVFTKAAIAQQYNPELLQKSGLSAFRNEQLYDNYRGRVIFPIHNISGKILGFGARILKPSERAPKYINTPENEIYVKSKILYGIFFARTAIDKADECLLVEGYTDVISLAQAGIENVVASGGTALTVDQLRLVKKYTNNLTIIYDGDAAGIKAALRGLDMALEEGLNVKLVLIPDKEDPDSYVNKVGANAFKEFVQANKKDFILFQLEVALRDAGGDSTRKAEVVNRIAETISKINKAEDFTRQQDYIKQCAEILKIDEQGLHVLVNKFIREKIASLERKAAQPDIQANTQQAEANNFDETTYNLLFKEDLQEKEVARVLLEYGNKPFNPDKLVADFVLEEMVDESLLENPDVIKFVQSYREVMQSNPLQAGKQYFIYHPDQQLSTFAVSLLNFPYEESEYWKKKYGQNTGYQTALFEQPYEVFIQALARGNEHQLMQFSRMGEDRTPEIVSSAVNYLKLRKIKRMLLENQQDMERQHTPEEYAMLHQTHEHLKQMEIELTKQMGTVIIR